MNIKKIIIGAGLLAALISANVSANLLIYPVRVSFNETERKAEMTLTNTSSQTNTYRLGWTEKEARSEGGYHDLTDEEAKNFPVASNMLRYSPRQVTLKPGERQLIKLTLRRARGLEEGEYRSHILFKAIPSKEESKSSNGTSTSVNIMMSFAVPVTIQQGKYDVEVSLKDANIAYNPTTGERKVSANLLRQGQHSASGDISAFWKAPGKKEVLIGKIADFNLWSELSEATPSFVPTEADFIPSDGRLRIQYEGVRDFKGNSYLDETVEIKLNQITIDK